MLKTNKNRLATSQVSIIDVANRQALQSGCQNFTHKLTNIKDAETLRPIYKQIINTCEEWHGDNSLQDTKDQPEFCHSTISILGDCRYVKATLNTKEDLSYKDSRAFKPRLYKAIQPSDPQDDLVSPSQTDISEESCRSQQKGS